MAATKQRKDVRSGILDRLFFAHPRSLGMSWAGHGAGAVFGDPHEPVPRPAAGHLDASSR